MKPLVGFILLLIASCKAPVVNHSSNESIDYFIIHTTLDLVHTEKIECNDSTGLTNRKLGFKFTINDVDQIDRIQRQLNSLVTDNKNEIFSSTLVMSGYNDGKQVFSMCSSSRLTSPYIINGKRLKLNSHLNSLLASLILEKFKASNFTCVNEKNNCDYVKENLFLMEEDYQVISNSLIPIINKGKDQ